MATNYLSRVNNMGGSDAKPFVPSLIECLLDGNRDVLLVS